jgi:alkanesulfonate monooxygenase SsuD/methylene tetrahydromethanopterin reductase-like flavin-dependent oxidoreductase (luciferase family)
VARDRLLLAGGRIEINVMSATRPQEHATCGLQSPHEIAAFHTAISLSA